MSSVVALLVQCGLLGDHRIMEAIVRVESGGNPNALAVNGDVELVRQPRNLAEAVAMARWLFAHGYNFDAGLGQVNSTNLARLGLDVSSVFDPCANLKAASRVLHECHERALSSVGTGERAVTAALSCYNTGHFTRGVANGYVAAVRASAAGPLAVHAREARDGAALMKASELRWRRGEQRAGSRSAARAGRRVTHATRPHDAFAKPFADAFGAAMASVKR